MQFYVLLYNMCIPTALSLTHVRTLGTLYVAEAVPIIISFVENLSLALPESQSLEGLQS